MYLHAKSFQSCPALRQFDCLQPSRLLCPWDSPRQEHWSGVPWPSPRDNPDQGTECSCIGRWVIYHRIWLPIEVEPQKAPPWPHTSGLIVSSPQFLSSPIGESQCDEAQAGIEIAQRNINNLRYADDTTLMAESEEELKILLMKVKKLA